MLQNCNFITQGEIMPKMYKRHSSSIKFKIALEAVKEQKTVREICQEYGVASSQVSEWKKHLEESASLVFERENKKDQQEEIDRLHRVIGQITAERDFLERVLKR
jgi:transposase